MTNANSNTNANNSIEEISLPKLLCLIFIPTSLLTIVYIITGFLQNTIPSILLFYLCAGIILFPIEIGIVMHASKKEYGSYSFKSSFSRHNKMSWRKILLYGSGLFAFAGIMPVQKFISNCCFFSCFIDSMEEGKYIHIDSVSLSL